MSARKLEVPRRQSAQTQEVTVEAHQARLTLSPEAVVIHKGGIEFRSGTPFPRWIEMTVTLHSPLDDSKLNCSGVVIDCTGNKHSGYHVSMIFTGLSKQAEARLNTLAGTQMGWGS